MCCGKLTTTKKLQHTITDRSHAFQQSKPVKNWSGGFCCGLQILRVVISKGPLNSLKINYTDYVGQHNRPRFFKNITLEEEILRYNNDRGEAGPCPLALPLSSPHQHCQTSAAYQRSPTPTQTNMWYVNGLAVSQSQQVKGCCVSLEIDIL